jgi:ankyrin repeat protein
MGQNTSKNKSPPKDKSPSRNKSLSKKSSSPRRNNTKKRHTNNELDKKEQAELNKELQKILDSAEQSHLLKFNKIYNLLNDGADIRIIDHTRIGYFKDTVLHSAVRNNKLKLVEKIIQLNGNLDIKNIHGDTPLMISTISSDDASYESMIMLLKAGADKFTENKQNISILHIAAAADNALEFKKFKIFWKYLNNPPVLNNENNNYNNNTYNINNNNNNNNNNNRNDNNNNDDENEEKKENNLNKKIDELLNLQDESGFTPLMRAVISVNRGSKKPVIKRNYEIIQLLLDKNPELNLQSKDGKTALTLAIQRNNINIVKLLLKKDPNLLLNNNNAKKAYNYVDSDKMDRLMIKYIEKSSTKNRTRRRERSPRR